MFNFDYVKIHFNMPIKMQKMQDRWRTHIKKQPKTYSNDGPRAKSLGDMLQIHLSTTAFAFLKWNSILIFSRMPNLFFVPNLIFPSTFWKPLKMYSMRKAHKQWCSAGRVTIQDRCWPNGCPKQDCIVVPPSLKYYGSKKNKILTYYTGQNRTLIKYKSK